eukprot:UN06154
MLSLIQFHQKLLQCHQQYLCNQSKAQVVAQTI